MTDPDIIELAIPRPNGDHNLEQLRRIKADAERLANQPELERNFFMERRAESLGVSVAVLRAAVNAVLNDRAQRVAADRLQQDRERKLRERQRADTTRKKQQAERKEERARHKAEKQAEQEAQRKEREKRKAFGELTMLPVARHAAELQRLAARLGADVAALRKEFEEEFLGIGGSEAPGETEPWPEPVDVAMLLSELGSKISRYVVPQPYQLTGVVLWTAHTWLYDHGVPAHSPLLALTSAAPDSGKTTAIAVIGRACPRYSFNVEITGPSLYRYVDRIKPTLMIDEADDLFVRRSDLKHVVNAGWTRGAKIPRQVNIGGVSQTVYFDPFAPKSVALLGRNLPQATRTRCIELRMLPKRADENVEVFDHVDDSEFAILRRKCARFAADNAAALKEAKPAMPPSLNNRNAANWRLLLAIADLAGGTWPQRAREAAERLTRSHHQRSAGVQLLAAFREIFADGPKGRVTSEDVATHLRHDPTSLWAEYNHGGPITQRQVAHLLDAFDIHPQPLHPTGRGDFGRRGYKATQFVDAFARYLPPDPIIRSPSQDQSNPKRRKPLKPRG